MQVKIFLLILFLFLGCAGQNHQKAQIELINMPLGVPSKRFISPPEQEDKTIKIASFNTQVFGLTKAGKPEVMYLLAQIISRYDIVAIQEIRDRTGNAIALLITAMNALGIDYECDLGPPVGRSRSKEQYAFMYQTDTIDLIDS